MLNTQRVSLLVVSHSYPPVLGGSEIEAQRVCSALIARGHEVRVLCAGGPPMPDQANWIDPAGVPVTIIGNRIPAGWRDEMFALGVASYIARNRKNIDLIYFLMQGLHLATGLLTSRVFDIPVVMKFSGSNIITALTKSRIGRAELRWLQQWARSVMVLNDGMVEEAVAAGFRREQLLWMPNPVDVEEFVPAAPLEKLALRDRFGLDRSATIAIYVGRLAPEKQLHSLIRAFSRVVVRAPDAFLVLVGDGSERASLETLARELDIETNIRFTGRVDAADIPLWLGASDTFALVSAMEGFPCSLVEAMAAGLPSVVSDIPANTQLIDSGVHGLTVPVGDVERIAAGFTRIFEDADFRIRAGNLARQRVVENFSTGKVASLYERLFNEVLTAGAAVAAVWPL